MNFPKFGEVVKESNHNSFKQFGEVVEDQGPSRTRSLTGSPVKGAIKGVLDTVSLANPFSALMGGNSSGPVSPQLQQKLLDKALPTQDNALEKGLERAGRLAPSVIGSPGSAIGKGVRVGAAAALGQAAEEGGAPEWAQTVAELLPFTAPKLGKNLIPKKSQIANVEFLRGKGLTDKEITPLIQSDKRAKILSKLSEKGQKTKQLLGDISSKLGQGYDELKGNFKKLKTPYLKGKDALDFDDALMNSLEKINPRFRRLLSSDLEALTNREITGEGLINFYQDINATVKGQDGGKAVLGTLKKPILDGLKKINPELAADFTKLNNFYAKKATLSKSLNPGKWGELYTLAKIPAALGGIVSFISTGNPGFLKTIALKEFGSKVFREMLINPRLQNLSDQMLLSLSKNKVPVLLRTLDQFKKELKKSKPGLVEEFNSKDKED